MVAKQCHEAQSLFNDTHDVRRIQHYFDISRGLRLVHRSLDGPAAAAVLLAFGILEVEQ